MGDTLKTCSCQIAYWVKAGETPAFAGGWPYAQSWCQLGSTSKALRGSDSSKQMPQREATAKCRQEDGRKGLSRHLKRTAHPPSVTSAFLDHPHFTHLRPVRESDFLY